MRQKDKECFKRQFDYYLDGGFSPYWQVFGLSE